MCTSLCDAGYGWSSRAPLISLQSLIGGHTGKRLSYLAGDVLMVMVCREIYSLSWVFVPLP